MMRNRVIICAVLASFLFGLYILIGEKIVFVVSEPIIVVRNLDDALTKRPENIIATVPAGERLRVMGCVDTKGYLIPKVRLLNGELGYVSSGQFELIRKPGWLSLNELNAFGC